MRRRILALVTCIAFLMTSPTFARDRDATERDVKGIPKSHRYAWAILGGTAVGMGIGVLAPGGSKSAFKGALIGGSAASAFYLIKDPRAAGDNRALAHIVTNTLLGTGVFWTVCNCGGGAWSGALIGGGGTAVIQAFGTHHRGLAKMSGTAQADTTTPPVTAQNPDSPAQNAPSVQPGSVPGQTSQNAPAQSQNTPLSQLPNGPTPRNLPAQAQTTPAPAQTAPAQAQSDPAQAQSVPVQPQSAPVQTQNAPAQAQTAPAQAQSDPAQVQSVPVQPQSAPSQTQDPPMERDDQSLSDNDHDGNNKISSAAPRTALKPPQQQRSY